MQLTKHAVAVYVHATSTGWEYGLLGIAEVDEREAILAWLLDDDEQDPRGRELSESADREPREEASSDSAEELDAGQPEAETPAHDGPSSMPPLRFIPAGLSRRWAFTKGDPDPHPSIPHGHLERKARRWPKLNPYTGRALRSKHAEDLRLRLSRNDMVALWNDDGFRGFCLDHIAWFIQQHPGWRFRVPNPMRLPRWRQR